MSAWWRRHRAVAGRVVKKLATLKAPTTAAAAVVTITGLLDPFGVDLSHQATRVAAVLTAIGLVSTYVQTLSAASAPRKRPRAGQ